MNLDIHVMVDLFNISFVLLDSSEIKWSANWLEAVSEFFSHEKMN